MLTTKSLTTAWFPQTYILLPTALVLVSAAACAATLEPTGGAAHDIAGRIDIGDSRSLFVQCRGAGSPTVILIAGKGNPGSDWSQILDPADPAHDTPGDDVGAGFGALRPGDDAVFPSVARFTRVCAYDRPDTGGDAAEGSTPGSQPHTVDRDVDDLHALLAPLGEREPVVLVAHSYGGLVATLFARTYPQSVAGLVMVDAATEHIAEVISLEKLASWNEVNRATSAQVREGVQVIDAIDRINAAPPMPRVPAVVLTADKPYRTDLLPPEVAQGDTLVSFAEWLAAQELLATASGADHITRTNSGHNIYLYSPALVVDAVQDVVAAARPGSSSSTSASTATGEPSSVTTPAGTTGR